MIIRLLTSNDIVAVMEIIDDAKKLLGKHSLQWQQGYPNEDTMMNDIKSSSCYGLFNEANYLIAIVSQVWKFDNTFC